MIKFFKTIVTAVTLSFVLPLSSAQAKLFDIEEFTLDNGLQVIVIPNHKAPIVKQMVWYKVGSVDEPAGKGGLAHLLEHLMFRGTEDVEDGAFNQIVSDNGGMMNAFTSRDVTAYHEFVDITRLELMMFLEADRMKNLNITPEAFEKERKIVFQERMQMVENNPTAAFGEMMRRTLWQEHPYARPVSGFPNEIISLTLEDAQNFYKTHYVPNNAVLVLSGDIDAVTAQTLAEKYFGKIEKTDYENNTEFQNIKNETSSKMLSKAPQIETSRFVKSFVVPSLGQDKSLAYAFVLLSAYLGEGDTSQLYRRLVEDEEVAVAVSTAYDFSARSYGTFSISALPAQGVSVETFEEKLNEALEDSIRRLNWEELHKVKNKVLAGLIYLKDNPSDAAEIVGSLASVGISVEDIENYDQNIEAVKLQDINNAVKLLRKAVNVQGFLLPQKGA